MSSLIQQEMLRVQRTAEKAAKADTYNIYVSTELRTSNINDTMHYVVYVGVQLPDGSHHNHKFMYQHLGETTKEFIKRIKREIKEHFRV